jgi:hypothetical protein
VDIGTRRLPSKFVLFNVEKGQLPNYAPNHHGRRIVGSTKFNFTPVPWDNEGGTLITPTANFYADLFLYTFKS